ncbi:MAG TPA: hypothetical protein PKE26_09905 [Kiritimatiellia bacterium]|mgnify:CR=1 FL=1|nr:hypothetical protein [Kiritimatiellia bacterium]HMO99411.1 hypothetical protein [Kiritimatiellia bacterium]
MTTNCMHGHRFFNAWLLLGWLLLSGGAAASTATHPNPIDVIALSSNQIKVVFNQAVTGVTSAAFGISGYTITAATQEQSRLDEVYVEIEPPLGLGSYRLVMGAITGTNGLISAAGAARYFGYGQASGTIFEELLDIDPGWTRQGHWEFGPPAWVNSDAYGTSGATYAYSGSNVFATVLTGDYANSISSTMYLTTPAIDCSDVTNVTFSFMRWLGLERNFYDKGGVWGSTNGTTWVTIWTNGNVTIDEGAWSLQQYDISTWADHQPTVYIRWGIGPTDSSWRFSGWALDDIRLTGESSVLVPPHIVTDANLLSIDEGTTTSLRVRLSKAPLFPTTVSVFRATGDVDISVIAGGSMIFTPVNWNSWQSAVIAAADDPDESHGVAIIRCASPNASTADVTVYEIDNDILMLLVSAAVLHVPEGGQASCSVQLNRNPGSNVVVTTMRISGDSDLSVFAGATLLFTPANWSVGQWVTIAAAEDDDTVNGAAVFRIMAAGVEPVEITAVEVDNDHGLPVTTVTLDDDILRREVARFGINIDDNYWEAPLLKVRAAFNFEGIIYRQMHEGEVHTNGFLSYWTQTNRIHQYGWNTIYTNGAVFRIVSGEAKGTTGRITRIESRVVDVYGNNNFTEQAFFVFEQPLSLQTNGVRNMGMLIEDYSKQAEGYLGETDYWHTAGTSLNTNDAPPGSFGNTSLRLDGAQGAILRAPTHFQRTADANGAWRVQFWSKRESGTPSLLLRSESSYVAHQNIILSNDWQFHDLTLTAANIPTPNYPTSDAHLVFRFESSGSGTVLLDDVLVWKVGHTNNTSFTDDALAMFRQLNPGIIRYLRMGGDTVANLLAPPLRRYGRRFGEYTSVGPYTDTGTKFQKTAISLHEVAELAEAVGAEPWFCLPGTLRPDEVVLFMEYLSGPTNTPGGAMRAELGRTAPWTDTFRRLHVEFGNEAWNMAASYKLGGFNGADYWRDLIAAGKAVPTYSTNILFHAAGQNFLTHMSNRILDQTPNADRYSIAPYMLHSVDTNNLAGLTTTLDIFNWFMAYPLFKIHENGLPQQGVVSSNKNTEFSLYEYNYHTADGGAATQPIRAGFHVSAAHGVSIVNTKLKMLETYGIRDQCFFQLFQLSFENSRLWGALHTVRPDRFRARPVFLGLQAANAVMDGDLVRVALTGDNPLVIATGRYDSANLLVRAYTAIHAYGFNRGSTNGLVLINHHLTETQRVRLALNKYPVNEQAQRWQVLAPSFDADNEPERSEPLVSLTHDSAVFFANEAEVDLPPASVTAYRWQAMTVIPRLILSTNALVINEGSNRTFTVHLSDPPEEPVVVLATVLSAADADWEVGLPVTRAYDAANWNVPQTFTIHAKEDPYGVDGSGVLRLSAGGLSSRDMTLTEIDNDPSGADGSTRRLLFDFGSGSAGMMTTNFGWNNVTTIAGPATPVFNAVDTNGLPTGIGLEIVTGFEIFLTDAPNTNTLYPAEAQRDFFRHAANAQIRLTGVPAGWINTVSLFGSGVQSYGSLAGYTVNGIRKTLDTFTNIHRKAVFSNVVADAQGRITITFDNAGLSYGRVNVLEIEGGFPAEPEDTDGDGLPDWYESMYTGSGTGMPANGDLDGDGVTNYEEFIAGTRPHDPMDYFCVDAAAPSPNGELMLTWQGVSGRVYGVHATPQLTDAFIPVRTGILWTQAWYVNSNAAATSIYYRIGVNLEP